ncbi:MAG TPA: radical SAM protein, partial [Candidatus Hypogeohydataceae bacterium YC38]
MSKRWLTEFCSLYKEEIKVPFVINSHLNNVEEDALDVLKDAGCELVRVGIESGNPRIRNDVLKRHPISNEEIVDLLGRIQSRG